MTHGPRRRDDVCYIFQTAPGKKKGEDRKDERGGEGREGGKWLVGGVVRFYQVLGCN